MTSSPTPAREKSGGNRFRSTLNLPSTEFAMKANLVASEPASVERWARAGLYGRVRAARQGAPRFVFHDGPPYANGSIHLGHLMNKTLKDFVVRTRTLMGQDCPYVPGWDCHGLPIEHKVLVEMKKKGELERLASLGDDERRRVIRRACRAYAEKYVALQAGEMKRLLTLADYDSPYLTMDPSYEGAVLEVLADLVEAGLVYRALKSVHWSIENETALAEAELEYEEREDISVYVDFEADDADAVYDAFGVGREDRPGQRPCFMIWTTTPWTLPANLAIAANPAFTYALVRVDGNVTVMAEDLVEQVTRAGKAEEVRVLGTAPGSKLLGLRYRHPLETSPPDAPGSPRAFTIVDASYVTLEDGTGLVHTAPGHGSEDYQTALRTGLPIYCPVLGDGRYDQTVPEWLRGVNIWKANGQIVERLRESGHLFHSHTFRHSYPHDWRSKTPVIFRATEQWFIAVERPEGTSAPELRQLALESIDASREGAVRFVPEWGRKRMRGMLESRPDWCISRQRAWGLPIPAFFTPEGNVLLTPASVRAVARVVREEGSDAWFTHDAATLLRHYDVDADSRAPAALRKRVRELGRALAKGRDILDVWFESGSSWNAVMRERSGGREFPTDLYLEGSDQHRGWFQSSLLAALGAAGQPPFRALLTHGFMVDKEGRKLSKSAGDTVEDLFRDYGADVMRWWVCSLSYENDVKVGREFFDLAGESYRKVRNTLRFMLGNIRPGEGGEAPGADFEPASIDAWAVGEYDRVVSEVMDAYERYDFQSAHRLLYQFCNEALSAVYLAAIKDRLYCDVADSPRRARTQRALRLITDGLCRLLAPVLCHTADEAYRALRGSTDDSVTVHTMACLRVPGVRVDAAWSVAMRAREAALAAMERAKSAIGVENPLDMGVTLPDPDGALARLDPVDLADLLGVSRVTLDARASEPRVADLRDQPRCERSWKRDGTVREREGWGMLSDRDAAAVGAR